MSKSRFSASSISVEEIASNSISASVRKKQTSDGSSEGGIDDELFKSSVINEVRRGSTRVGSDVSDEFRSFKMRTACSSISGSISDEDSEDDGLRSSSVELGTIRDIGCRAPAGRLPVGSGDELSDDSESSLSVEVGIALNVWRPVGSGLELVDKSIEALKRFRGKGRREAFCLFISRIVESETPGTVTVD